jgi:hypothetical protein
MSGLVSNRTFAQEVEPSGTAAPEGDSPPQKEFEIIESGEPSPAVSPSTVSACDGQRAHVTVRFRGSWSPRDQAGVLSDLTAALSPQKIAVCRVADASGKAIAAVVLERLDGDSVRIDVADELTNKRVSRDITVSRSSDGSSALVIAVAADELLRATWAELSLRKKEEAKPPPPPPPQEEERPEPPSPVLLPSQRVGISGAADVFVQGSAFFGGDIVFGSHFGDVVEWTLFGGPRASRQQQASSLGGVSAIAASWGGSLGLPVVRAQDFVFGPLLSLQAMYAWYSGQAANPPEVEGRDARGWSLNLRGGAMARVRFDHFYVNLSTEWGGAMRGFEVTDGRGVVGGMRGLLWSSSVGVGGCFAP